MEHQNKIDLWHAEEAAAHIHGWDFSHIADRYEEEDDIPWSYREEILSRLTPNMRILDIDTGGGEFLLSLGHPHENTAATESFPPNVSLCKSELLPLGIDFQEGGGDHIPFDDRTFDMVINRHGDFDPQEIHRVLKPGGLFITQQVGAQNDRELVKLLLGDLHLPFPDQFLIIAEKQFKNAGFEILKAREHYGTIRFFDVGALVWFARIIEWEFPGFSVDACLPRLLEAEKLLQETGSLDGRTHRFLLVVKKA
ncbi:MAG: class I SAM-dependent methyltransferase [Clostridia bacterium]|nr:class I SAM-dependent methyltransferase [Clostridia bacterium]